MPLQTAQKKQAELSANLTNVACGTTTEKCRLPKDHNSAITAMTKNVVSQTTTLLPSTPNNSPDTIPHQINHTSAMLRYSNLYYGQQYGASAICDSWRDGTVTNQGFRKNYTRKLWRNQYQKQEAMETLKQRKRRNQKRRRLACSAI